MEIDQDHHSRHASSLSPRGDVNEDMDEITSFDAEDIVDTRSPNPSFANVNDQQPMVVDFNMRSAQIDDSTKFSLELHALLTRRGLSRDPFDEVIKMVNNYMQQHAPQAPTLLSAYLNEKLAGDTYPVTSKSYDMCCNGCKLFGPNDDAEECTLCDKNNGTPRWVDGKPAQQATYLSIAEQLALLLYDVEVREMLEYPTVDDSDKNDDTDEEHGCMNDIFDGAIVRNIVKSNGAPTCKSLMLEFSPMVLRCSRKDIHHLP